MRIADSRHGERANRCTEIQTFTHFLRGVKRGTDTAEQDGRRAILLKFLQSRRPTAGEAENTALSGLIQTWHFAVQANSEGVCSSVASCLASLLKAVSGLVEFRESGKALCRALLQDDQLTLFDRSLSAHRRKEHLIAPCLRLLTEIVLFDGGNSAKIVFRQRRTTFQRLDVFLSMRNDEQRGANATKRRPPVREAALRYLFANLRLQGRTAKGYILGNSRTARSLLQGMAGDPPWVVREILTALRRDVQEDAGLPRSTKTQFFSDWTLSRLAALYHYDEADELQTGSSVRDAVHSFLLFTCTSPGHGFLVDGDGGDAADEFTTGSRAGSDGEDSRKVSGFGQVTKQRRVVLNFLQSLRPYADVLQADLILECFRAAPSLTDEYFSGSASFSFEPKLTATWIGYSRFLLAVIQLPASGSLLQAGRNQRTVIERSMSGILPRPLTAKILTRCLNQSLPLITFFAVRILSAAFDKLTKVTRGLRLKRLGEHGRSSDASQRIVHALHAEFCARCPEIKHVVARFRSCPSENTTLAEALARLLASYYTVLPAVALEEKFDISSALCRAVSDLDQAHERKDRGGLVRLELDHLLVLASRTPNMQWWHRPGRPTV